MASKPLSEAIGPWLKANRMTLASLLLGAYLIVFAGLLAYMLYALWPPDTRPETTANGQALAQDSDGEAGAATKTVDLFGGELDVTAEERLLLLVMVTAALGSYVHAATSVASYWGNKKFEPRWTGWYFLRPMIGVALGLVFYVVLRAGILTSGDISEANPYGFLAVAALAGMFSKQAADKLSEVFNTMFSTESDPRGDKLVDPKPEITDIDPTSVAAGSADTTIKVSGKDFVERSQVRLDGEELQTRYIGPGELEATVPAARLAGARKYRLTVFTPEPGGGESNHLLFEVK